MEKSCGIVLFNSEEFLLIQHPAKSNGDEGHWDFPKGHVEGRETELETAKRELIEETGIVNFRLLDGFRYRIEYNFQKGNEMVPKEVIFFLAESNNKEVVLSSEHQNFVWLNKDLAYNKLTYTNAKEVLAAVKIFLEK
ncbi:MAG: diadenosine tetraphosphate hydrolase [Euryarchaeota archaeon]|jgi:bis(5'-nucleosidyl)-tetraphosphatase|nr:diadenosine tetraphosphate hydrolase [Euryarchaeota archaeon]|tara:strand:- start:2015 stop:2428 length:414 start_codon:yes stop_codon:yes gene_type:complete